MGNKQRDDFPPRVKQIVAQRAAYHCSNPDCRRLIIAGALTQPDRIVSFGVAAHMTAAAHGGPRYDENLSPEERASLNNAIHLCANCAMMIDKNNGADYPLAVLQEWKQRHEEWAQTQLGRSPGDRTIEPMLTLLDHLILRTA